MDSQAQGGFSRVELIVVVVLLGMVVAVAIPRYHGYEANERVAAVKNMGGMLKSAALMAHTVCQAQSCANNQTIVIRGEAITFINGYPDAASIGKLVPRAEGFTPSGGGNRFAKNGADTGDCWVQYDNATIEAPPTISYQAGTIIDSKSEQAINAALRTQC